MVWFEWTSLEPGGATPLPMKGATLATLDKTLYCFGGVGGGFSNDVHSLVLSTMEWRVLKILGHKPDRRAYHACVVFAGCLWIFGGLSARGRLDDTWRLYLSERQFAVHSKNQCPHECDGTWSRCATVGEVAAREGHAAVVIDENLVALAGFDGVAFANSVDCLNLETLVWWRPAVEGEVPSGRAGHSLTLVPGDSSRCVVIGGYDGRGAISSEDMVAFFSLDVTRASLRWEKLRARGPPLAPRHGHSAVGLEASVVVFGGAGGGECYGDTNVLSFAAPHKPTWRKRLAVAGVPPRPRFAHAATRVGPKDGVMMVVVFGGCTAATYAPPFDPAPALLDDGAVLRTGVPCQ